MKVKEIEKANHDQSIANRNIEETERRANKENQQAKDKGRQIS